MSRFQDLELDPRIVKGLNRVMYLETFPIQEKAIGPMLRGMDVIGQARAGMGKTAAYGIPLLQVVDERDRNVQGLVLAPTRELAVQIAHEIRRLGKYTGVRVTPIYGGQSINIQLKALAQGVQIVVGTPGRIIDLIKRGKLLLNNARFVVLDEADTMLDMGFIDDVEFILKSTSNIKQLSLFSATMPERVIQLASKYMKHPERIFMDSDPSLEKIDQYYTSSEEENKLATLTEILKKEKPSSAIIFCATRYRTHRLAQELARRFQRVAFIHGNLRQHQRDHVMSLFRSQRISLLVATDIAARGIDVPHVACVINYDVPNYPLIYFHRVGRTARAGRSGKSFTLVSNAEFNDFMRIQEMTTASIKALYPEDKSLNSHVQYYRPQAKRRGFHRRSPLHGWSKRRRFSGTRKMYKATCYDCSKETEVPFKPTKGRPVYCRECYQKHGKISLNY